MQEINDNKEFEIEIKEDPAPFIQEGIYEAIYIRHIRRAYFGGTKLYVYYKIVTPGEYFGIELYRAYTVYDVPKRNSDFVKECEVVLGYRLKKKEKARIVTFKDKVLKVKVKTVKVNRKQEPLSPHMQYSKIETILGVVAGKR